MSEAAVGALSPFFVVTDVTIAIAYYRDRLGFRLIHSEGGDAPFFAILHRGGAMLFLKSEEGIAPMPNSIQHPNLPWDAYCYTEEPEALAAEFAGKAVAFHAALGNRSDGLRGFSLADPDGHVIFFGRPMQAGE
jgi:catechol 2,3-dioxygenase-like lactoylglutathione lyase family enzyme